MVLWACEKDRLVPQTAPPVYEKDRSVYEMVPRAYEKDRSVYGMVPRACEKDRLVPQTARSVYGKVPRDHERVLRGRQHGMVLHRGAVLSVRRGSAPDAAVPHSSGRS